MKTPGTLKGQNVAIILVIVVVAVLLFIVVNKFFGGISGFFKWIGGGVDSFAETLNIKDTEQEKQIRQSIEDATQSASTVSSPWNSTYYRSAPVGTKLLNETDAKNKAKQIWDSVGTFTDDSDAGVAVFKTLATKAQVSYLCYIFNRQYSRDLFQWLKNKYDTDSQRANLKVIIDYVNSLKSY